MKIKKNGKPFVSICIPTYNALSTIKNTISSILNQTYKNFELIIIDNASTDNTIEIVRGFDDSRIKVIQNEINIGAEANFERCFKYAEGKYTAIFHSDDLYNKDIILNEINFLEERKDVGAVFTMAQYIDEKGNFIDIAQIPKIVTNIKDVQIYNFEEIFKLILRYFNFLICPSAMVRSSIYKNHVKKWDGERFGTSADLGVWLKILEKYSIGILPEILISYRISKIQTGAKYRRFNIQRSDFFKVIDYYLEQENVKKFIQEKDLNQLFFLERVDNYSRAMKCLITGNTLLAKELTKSVWNFKLFIIALITKPQRLVNKKRIIIWFSGIVLFFAARIPCQKFIKKLLYRIRYGSVMKLFKQ
ncbi:MAG: glycosyltransferase [Clostridiales bacterium]